MKTLEEIEALERTHFSNDPDIELLIGDLLNDLKHSLKQIESLKERISRMEIKKEMVK